MPEEKLEKVNKGVKHREPTFCSVLAECKTHLLDHIFTRRFLSWQTTNKDESSLKGCVCYIFASLFFNPKQEHLSK